MPSKYVKKVVTCTCARCGGTFEGKPNQKYHSECYKEANRERMDKKYKDKIAADNRIGLQWTKLKDGDLFTTEYGSIHFSIVRLDSKDEVKRYVLKVKICAEGGDELAELSITNGIVRFCKKMAERIATLTKRYHGLEVRSELE